MFGYRNVRIADHVERDIVTAGFAKIAKTLNADAVPCPRGRRWAMTGVRAMVFRDLYRGRLVYGCTRWEYRRGRKFKVRVPEAEWITVEAPALRIVPDELWHAAHARIARTRAIHLRGPAGRLNGRPVGGGEARYLLSGLVVCAVCKGSMHAV